MNDKDTIDAEVAQMPLTLKQGDNTYTAQGTPQQMRVMEVSVALEPAYRNASTLELTDKEVESLMAPFPDEAVEIRPHDGLIYIPHIAISNRLNHIFRPGKWALIKRRDWFDSETNTMYGEYVLVIRGCFVGESIGGHAYVPNNPKTNLSDALESTAAEALRRICGKRLSCGSQVWEPEYARQWVSKNAAQVNGKWQRRMTGDPQAQKPAPSKFAPAPAGYTGPIQSMPKPEPKPKDNPPTVTPAVATEEQRAKMIAQLEPVRNIATTFMIEIAAILPTETLEDTPLGFVPSTVTQMKELQAAIGSWADDNIAAKLPWMQSFVSKPKEIVVPRDANPEPGAEDAPWRSFPMPFGKQAGVKLEDLEKSYLFGLWANFKPEETWTNAKGDVVKTKPDKLAKDKLFRQMLNECGSHYEFVKKD